MSSPAAHLVDAYMYHQTHVPEKFKENHRVPKYLKSDQPKKKNRYVVTSDVLNNIDFRLTAAEMFKVLENNTTKGAAPTRKRRRGKKRRNKRKKNPQSSKQSAPLPTPSAAPPTLLVPHPPTKGKAWSSLTVATTDNRRRAASSVANSSRTKGKKCNSPTALRTAAKKTSPLPTAAAPPPTIASSFKHAQRTLTSLDEKIKKARREAQPWMFKTKTSARSRDRDMSTDARQQQHPASISPPASPSPKNAGPAVPKLNLLEINEQQQQQQADPAPPPGSKTKRDFVRHNKIQSTRRSLMEGRRLNTMTKQQVRRKKVYKRSAELREMAATRSKNLALKNEQRRALRFRHDETTARQQAWMKIIKMAAGAKRLQEMQVRAQETRQDAAMQKSAVSVILGAWARKNAAKKGEMFRGAYVTVQRACFNLIMRRRRTMKRRAAGRLMTFVLGIASQRFRGAMLRFRSCVIKAQRYWRSFRACKHARILALHHIWDEVETELRIIEKRNRQKRLRKMLKKLSETSPWLNAAVRRERVDLRRATMNKTRGVAGLDMSGIRLEGDNVDGVQFVIGDRAAALLDKHLRDGLRLIMCRNEIKAQEIETVPFDIRFEVCHTLLTELRKKHALDVSTTKMDNLLASLNGFNSMAGVGSELDSNGLLRSRGVDGEASGKSLSLPPFIVYTRLGEDSLLTIVNAGRILFNKRKEEGYQSKFNVTPMYTPNQEMSYSTRRDEDDDIVSEVMRDERDRQRTEAAKIRRSTNMEGYNLSLKKERQENLYKNLYRNGNKASRDKKIRRAAKKMEKNKVKGTIVSVPQTWESRRRM